MRLFVVLLLSLLASCTAVSITESPWKAAPGWSADQHRRMAERFEVWMDEAEPVRSLDEVIGRLALPGVVIVGESHDSSEWAKAIVKRLLGGPEVHLWEEGIIWSMAPGKERLQGLYSRRWEIHDSPERRVIAGGNRFNREFAARLDSRPASLVVYAGNAHVIHTPELDGAEPRSGGPLPADAAAAAGARVSAIAVYPRANLLSYLDLNMAVSLLAAASDSLG